MAAHLLKPLGHDMMSAVEKYAFPRLPENTGCIFPARRGILPTMPKRNKHERPKDVNQLAHRLVGLSTQQESGDIPPPTKAQVSLLMSSLGRKGGKIGGKRRMETMTANMPLTK